MRQLLRYYKLLSETIGRYEATLAFDNIEQAYQITIYMPLLGIVWYFFLFKWSYYCYSWPFCNKGNHILGASTQ